MKSIAICCIGIEDIAKLEIKELIKAYCEQRSCAKIVTNMSHSEYVEKMQHAALVVGNSSAGA